ncbi:hypothetical protein MRB53_029186 [Persea americana]|uniref:Uncharacterized protein n=1 Tax=Persea americana TaxID=3435 RepID=A0ACC2KI29_PERAE|nr:hypothetical protein MRB53_029186 [Persea americana]
MGTEILHPQHCLNQRFRSVHSISTPPSSSSSGRRTYANPNPNPRFDNKRRDSRKSPNPTIMRRGRDFRGKAVSFDVIVSGIGRLETNSDVYAGSAFSQSPSPSSLPLPTFSRKREGVAVVDDTATRDLRRLLRIG